MIGLVLLALLAAPLSLAEAQAEARAHAPEAAELEARLRGAQAVAEDARRIFRRNPELSGGYAPGALVGQADESSWSLGLRWPLDVSGSSGPRTAAAAAGERRTRFDREDGLRALDEAAAVAVADLALAQRQVAHAGRTVSLVTVAAEAAQREMDVGTGNQLDLDAATLDLDGARASAAEARAEAGKAQAALARLLARPSIEGLEVEDPPEPALPAGAADLDAAVRADPRVHAAAADADAARSQLQLEERLAFPALTLGLDFARKRHDIPPGSFVGAAGGGLSANWTDSELGVNLSVPLPLFERRQEERAQSWSRLLSAQARVDVVRASARAELQTAWAEMQAAGQQTALLAKTAEIIDRDYGLLEKAMRAGALDAVARALSVRRLVETQRRADLAVHDLRVARARWTRRTASSQAAPVRY